MMQKWQRTFDTMVFYSAILFTNYSPGTLGWKFYKNRKGKVAFLTRDFICDTETLMKLPPNESSLDELTTAFSPFIPLLTLNGLFWKKRRTIFVHGVRKIDLDQTLDYTIPYKKGDIYWDIYSLVFKTGFKLIFGRECTLEEFNALYPGIVDINKLIKRQSGLANFILRQKLYDKMLTLLNEKNEKFIFNDCKEFDQLEEIHKISIIVEDLLTSLCIQCTDLICHLCLLYSQYSNAFKENLDNCINETLRLFPLTDIWTRKATDKNRGWMASLMLLNRAGWENPDEFISERWNTKNHPPLISWVFDSRSCPASNIGYNLSKQIFTKAFLTKNVWVVPASNFKHDRTFSSGCQVWIGKGNRPLNSKWKYKRKWQKIFQQWWYGKLRLIDQKELW